MAFFAFGNLQACRFRSKSLYILALVVAAVVPCSDAIAVPAVKFNDVSHFARIVSKVAVFGADERAPLAGSQLEFKKTIGTLTSRKTGATCTAFCVGPDVIATASHCLFGTAESAKPDITDMEFALHSGSAIEATPLAGLATGMVKQNIISGTEALAVRPPIDAANDWAIARTETAICHGGGLKLSEKSQSEIAKLARDGAIYQVAMHRDLPQPELMLGKPCGAERTFPGADAETIARDFRDPEAVIFHTCDTGGGSSGSPLLIDGANGPDVIGINVGTYVLSKMVLRASGKAEPEKSQPIANTAVETARFSGAVATLSARDLIRDPSEVRHLEIQLRKYQLYRGRATGHLTGDLEEAIKHFETLTGRQPTGLIRRALLSEIETWAHPSKVVKAKY